jgi:hypothetical protein
MTSTTSYVCGTCGTQYPPSDTKPAACPICEDARQWVPEGGHRWVTYDEMRRRHRAAFLRYEPGLLGVGATPDFAIGQRAMLLERTDGNVLWDCVAPLTDATIDILRALGGIRAIAISHPHYYTTMVEWAHTFDCDVWLHEDDAPWVMRPDARVQFWSGETKTLADGLTLIRCGGHFAGGQVLHWKDGANGKGALLTGDIVQAIADRRYVSFMWSYPNLVPLPATAIDRIEQALAPFAYERLYGAWWNRATVEDAKNVVARSAARYREALRRVLA